VTLATTLPATIHVVLNPDSKGYINPSRKLDINGLPSIKYKKDSFGEERDFLYSLCEKGLAYWNCLSIMKTNLLLS
jgi:hypothetical protein